MYEVTQPIILSRVSLRLPCPCSLHPDLSCSRSAFSSLMVPQKPFADRRLGFRHASPAAIFTMVTGESLQTITSRYSHFSSLVGGPDPTHRDGNADVPYHIELTSLVPVPIISFVCFCSSALGTATTAASPLPPRCHHYHRAATTTTALSPLPPGCLYFTTTTALSLPPPRCLYCMLTVCSPPTPARRISI